MADLHAHEYEEPDRTVLEPKEDLERDPASRLDEPTPVLRWAGAAALEARKHLGGSGNGALRRRATQDLQRRVGNVAVRRWLEPEAASSAPAREDLGEAIHRARPEGRVLDRETRGTLEGAMDTDLSHVRVHSGPRADRLARAVDALAFTSGSDMFFREGTYHPGSSDGMELLAHEATHTVQQSSGPVAGTDTGGGVVVSSPDDAFERRAARTAKRVAGEVQRDGP